MMEQVAKDDTTTLNISPSKRLKQHEATADTPGLDENNQRVATTSHSLISLDVNISTLEISLNQQPTEIGLMNYKVVLLWEEDAI